LRRGTRNTHTTLSSRVRSVSMGGVHWDVQAKNKNVTHLFIHPPHYIQFYDRC
jgi:hypothetical protein